MNKILIVGHPDSGYEEVEALLQACGMARAKPSRREGLSARDIGAMLGKSQEAPAGRKRSRSRKLRQVAPSPMWQGLALDLMLGNLDQPLWGWSDPQAIHLLDYWREADPSIHFVFVYDRPHSVIARSTRLQCDARSADELLDGWCAFNATVLDFLRRSPERALLVHRAQVRASADLYLSQVRARIHAPWNDGLQPAVVFEGQVPAVGGSTRPESGLGDFVADALVSRHPASQSLYLRIQKRATLALPATDVVVDPALAAWHALAAHHRCVEEHQREFQQRQQLEKDKASLAARLEAAEKERAELARASRDASGSLKQLQDELAQLRTRMAKSQAEGESERGLLTRQLHAVQEQLEAAYAAQSHGSAAATNPPAPAPTGAADRVRNELAYRVGELLVERGQSLAGWASLPFALLRVTMADRRRRSHAPAAAPLESYSDYQDAARLQRHLRYRLGAAFLRNASSPLGWARMPWALKKELASFRLERGSAHQPAHASA